MEQALKLIIGDLVLQIANLQATIADLSKKLEEAEKDKPDNG